jgi:putative transposase
MILPVQERRTMVDPSYTALSIRRQCTLLSLPRASWYYTSVAVDDETLALMNAIDRQYTKTPFYGIRKMTIAMNERGFRVNHKRIARLMQLMGIHAIYSEPKLSIPGQNHNIYPYLLTDVPITTANQVWSSDITYIPMMRGFMYCVAVIDWFSRYVLSWGISNTQDAEFCVHVLERALQINKPEIFNTDQGSQFTSEKFTARLNDAKIRISMDGRGRVLDNIFIERLWRSMKYEDVYLHNYSDPTALYDGLECYFNFYNYERYHQALQYSTPADIYFSGFSAKPRWRLEA